MLKKIWYAIILSAVITAGTGLVNTTPQGILGASWFGFPLAYRYVMVTFPPATGWDFVNLGIDFAVFFIVILVVLWLLGKIWK